MKNSEILDAIRFYKRFATKKAFANHLGIKANVLSNWYSRGTFDEDIILNKIPEINRAWLLTGEGEMLNHSHNGTTHNTQNNNNNIHINSPEKTTAQQEAPEQGKKNENNIYTEMIATQRELIDTLKEQNSQYRKEIEYLRQKIKGYVEKSKK